MMLSERIQCVLRSGGAQAVEWDGRWYSWSELAEMADQVGDELRRMGVPSRSPVAVTGHNNLWIAAAFFAVLASERCVALLNPFQAPERLAEEIAMLDLAALVGLPEDYASGEILERSRVSGLGALQVDGSLEQGLSTLNRGAGSLRDTGEVALLIPTSGTTGAPKRIPICADALMIANAEAEIMTSRFGEFDVPPEQRSPLIQYSPLVHITGALSVARCGTEMRRLIMLKKFTPEAWVGAVERNSIRTAGLPPTMMRMVMDMSPPPERLKSLVGVWTGSAPADVEVVKAFEARYDVRVMGIYGATEYCGPVASGAWSDRDEFGMSKGGTVGRVWRSVADFRIVDTATMLPLPAGEVGTLEIKVHHMGGKWMRTADLARLDEDDFLYIHGRTDDAIIRGGFKIVPSVVREILKRHPQVSDAEVVGLPDRRLGQRPVAAVEVRRGVSVPSEDDLIAFLRKQLAPYQVPTAIKLLPALPRTPSLKIDKLAVRALFESDV